MNEEHGGLTWESPHTALQPGDRFTIAGLYQRRTWWQWLTRQPRRLQVHIVQRSDTDER